MSRPPHSPPPATVAADARTKRLTLLACILGSTIVMVDGSVVNVALPHISKDLGGGLAGQQWTSNAYLLTLGSLLMVAGSLGDVFGERRIFLLGVAGFGVTSLICAAAPSIGVLIAGRALQGASGALLTPAALAVIVATFDEDDRNRAIGSWTAWGGIGAAIGPLLGGWLVDAASWQWVFLINVPLVLLTLWIIVLAIPAAGERGERRLDLVGAALCATGLAGLTFGLIQQPLAGWGSLSVVGPLAGGALVFAVFLLYERRAREPMLPLDLFRRRNFAVGNVETLVMYAGLALVFFYLTIYLQQVAGFDALKAGLAGLPVTILMLLLASRFGALADRIGPRLFMGAGPVVSGVGLLLLLRLDRDVSYLGDVLPAMVVFGIGLCITVAPLTATVLADADAHNAGAASGVNNAIARVAGLIGIAAVGVVVASSFSSGVADRLEGRPLSPAGRAVVADARDAPLSRPDVSGLPAAEARAIDDAAVASSTHSFHLGMGVSAGLLLLGGALGAAGIRNPRRLVRASECAGGQLVGQPCDAAHPERGAAEPASA
ncbi:transmembrane efflux protein [Patulibacter medicamentivorans]|uniref:Transmembrane efflux protein n=1 Tax=Patulibacter medicamentivorans TaxID=1097667 RepID=H0E9F4_9ACTN|nr:MFS transporter [Patulibacter medicamentivorans]EHN09687.1 transmembrane efflux protein [Patulibacter medicamentivorans]